MEAAKVRSPLKPRRLSSGHVIPALILAVRRHRKPLRNIESLTNLEIVTGALKGYDALMNLVLDDVEEVLRGE